MSAHDKLLAEYETIQDSDIWDRIISKIMEYRAYLSNMCETKETPTKEQGGIEAVNFILGRDFVFGKSIVPSIVTRILDDAKKESQK